MNHDAKLDMLKMLDRFSLDTVQGVVPSYRAVVSSDKTDRVCLRGFFPTCLIVFLQALLPPTDGFPTKLPLAAADHQRASRRVEFTVPLNELQARPRA